MGQPFENVRILDFTRFVAGPFGTYQLALLGADVIKIEPPGGEDTRVTPTGEEWVKRKLSPSWLGLNANKRSIVLDLRKPEAVEIVKRLVPSTDVVWENFRPGVMDRLGIGYEVLAAINPRLIYAAVSGFGRTGPERGTAAFDGKIQALSGIMSITGHEETGPTRVGFAASDIIAGMTAAFAVSSALYQRTHTGKGQLVDVAMLDASLNFMAQQVAEYTVGGFRHGLAGNQAVSRKPTGNMFKTKRGGLLLAVVTERQYTDLMRGLGRADALDDPRFADWPSRAAHAAELREVIESALADKDAREWEAILTEAGVPCSAVWRIGEVVEHPQLKHRGFLQTVDSEYGPLALPGPGFRLAHGNGKVHRAPPAVAQDAEAILAEAGYTQAEIARLRADAVI